MNPRTKANLTQASWTIFPIFLVLYFCTSTIVGFIAMNRPKLYESTSIIDEQPPPSAAPETSMQITHNLALKIAEIMSLSARWKLDDDEIVRTLKSAVSISRSADGQHTEISCRHTIEEDARDIAGLTAEFYPGWDRYAAIAKLSPEQQLAVEQIDATLEIQKQLEARKEKLELSHKQSPPEDELERIRREIDVEKVDMALADVTAELNRAEADLPFTSFPPPSTLTWVTRPQVGRFPVAPDPVLWGTWGRILGVTSGILGWWLYMTIIRKPLTDTEFEEHLDKEYEKHKSVDY